MTGTRCPIHHDGADQPCHQTKHTHHSRCQPSCYHRKMRKLASELTIGKARQGRNSMRHMMNSVESQLEIADTVKHLILGTSSFIPRNHTRKLHPGIVSTGRTPHHYYLLLSVVDVSVKEKKRKHCIILVNQTKITAATISTCGKTEVHIFVPVAFNLTLKRRVRNQSTYFTQSGLRQGVGFT